MNKHTITSPITRIAFSAVMVLASQQAAANSIVTNDYSLGGGDYFITANDGESINATDAGAGGGGVSFDGSSFLTSIRNNLSGSGGGFINLDVYSFDHSFTGDGASGAEVLDPLNQLADIQIDGETLIDFKFSIATPHTYTLTGNLSATNTARASLSFDSVTFTQLDGAYSLTGTLAPGEYTLAASTIADLTAPGSTSANFDFDLQLTEVPLPAAFWLFASGLAGLFGVTGAARRKQASAAG